MKNSLLMFNSAKKLISFTGLMLVLVACQTPTNKNKTIPSGPSVAESNAAIESKTYSSSYKVRGKRYNVLANSEGFQQRGYASWYSHRFENRRTTSGERYHAKKLTAAHRNLPLHSYVKVKNLENGREIIVKVNDRGPFKGGDERIIDLSYVAAKKLGIIGRGKGYVEIETIAANQIDQLQQQVDPVQTTYVLSSEKFSSRQKAKQFDQRIKTLIAENTEIKRIKSKRSTRYVVNIGPYSSKKSAQKSETKLTNAGLSVKRIETFS